MVNIKKMVDDVIEIAKENMDSEFEGWYSKKKGAGYVFNLIPRPELHEKLNTYFSGVIKDILLVVLEKQFGYKGVSLDDK